MLFNFTSPAAINASNCAFFALASAATLSACSFSHAFLASCAAFIFACAVGLSTFKASALLYSATALSKSLLPNLLSPAAMNLSNSTFLAAAASAADLSACSFSHAFLASCVAFIFACAVGLSTFKASALLYSATALSKSLLPNLLSPAAMNLSNSAFLAAAASAADLSVCSFSHAFLASCAAFILACAVGLSTFKARALLYSATALSKSLLPNLLSPAAINLSNSAFLAAAASAADLSACSFSHAFLASCAAFILACAVGLSTFKARALLYSATALSKSLLPNLLSPAAMNLSNSTFLAAAASAADLSACSFSHAFLASCAAFILA